MISDTGALDVEEASAGRFTSDPAQAFESWDDILEWAHEQPGDRFEPYSAVDLGPPSPRPRQVFAIGANYRSHLEEVGGIQPPREPVVFTKFSSCIGGPFQTVPLPSQFVDWEAELVVIIGSRSWRVAEREAWRHVAGVTVGQDLTDRVLQLSGAPAPQFCLGKSFPGFGPLGPVLVTPDELDDPDDIEIGCSINGEVLQKARTIDMLFPVPTLISYLSRVCPLLPGDVIFTGTPAGIGATRNPPRFLRPGQTLVTWGGGVGELHNTMGADEHGGPR
jgi:2-keto-4-pentenoate hydratase/2-oxohepta-3-ene-1,7-dioic acid hydratase in catechol pathway